MQCVKQFSLECSNQCVGISNLTWTSVASGNDANKTAAGSGANQYGTFTLVQTGGPFTGTFQIQLNGNWTGVAGRTLRVRLTFVGTITTGSLPNNYFIRTDANGVVVSSGFVPTVIGVNNINTSIQSTAPTVNGNNSFLTIANMGTRGTCNLSGEVFITCEP